mmetsp:Transcript_56603/g.156685  ORF Transcript_56603/g.156685 Transcript_56603/m.156685 type:complete len:215 (-) Transcript_56603:168-812(-)
MNVANIGTDIYISSAVNAALDVPAMLLARVGAESKWLGRRLTTVGGLAAGGMGCFLAALLAGGSRPGLLATWIPFAGKFGVSVAFGVVFMWGSELFPTTVRSRSLGLQTLNAQVGAMLAPLVASLGKASQALAMLAFGSPCLVAAALLVRLPETLGRPMLGSIEEIPLPVGGPRLSCLRRYRSLEEEQGREPAPCRMGASAHGSAEEGMRRNPA